METLAAKKKQWRLLLLLFVLLLLSVNVSEDGGRMSDCFQQFFCGITSMENCNPPYASLAAMFKTAVRHFDCVINRGC